ncbi:glycosyltransferase family 2 protein [Pseudovibrio brasiliensis]|uniref:Glycosyltransferase family 2 protein n=1 Tax=Pseudovibrio brasiliensis TaxID=1898042 RepID=A0ABX8AIN5_9HYPH|nr:glycosyltransferase family 2 protein [Pseudovibrio brasiliensis]QUS54889.1 glycosyltransferase family 2 protein [Pseudovibrio brasiliensis]
MTISVIVPIWNAEKTLQRCLNSLEAALPIGSEILLFDDQSSDKSVEIATEFAQGSMFSVRLFKEQSDGSKGPGYLRNRGIREAKRDFVSFVDADDWVQIEHFDELLTYFDDNLEFVRSGYTRLTDEVNVVALPIMGAREVQKTQTHTSHDFVLPHTKKTAVDFANCWAGLFRTNFLRKLEDPFAETVHAEDRLFIWKLYLSGVPCKHVVSFNYVYVNNLHSITNTVDDRILDIFKVYLDIYNFILHVDRAFLFKFYRQFIALTAHHLKLAQNSRRLKRKLTRGLREFVVNVQTPELYAVLDELSDAQRKRLRESILIIDEMLYL